MKKLPKIDAISIKEKNGKRTVRINGSKVSTYDTNGVSFLSEEIEAVEPNKLGCFNPIVVEFDEVYIKNTGSIHLENLNASIKIIDDNLLEVFVIFMDPHDMEDIAQHEAFQLALEQVVANDKNLELYTSVKENFSKTLGKKLQKFKDESAGQTPGFDFSEVGFVSFIVIIAAKTFSEAFTTLEKIASGLEKKARKNMKAFL